MLSSNQITDGRTSPEFSNIDIEELRKDCWMGIPHKLRPMAWRILSVIKDRSAAVLEKGGTTNNPPSPNESKFLKNINPHILETENWPKIMRVYNTILVGLKVHLDKISSISID